MEVAQKQAHFPILGKPLSSTKQVAASSQPHMHAAAVAFHRCVQKLLHLGKRHNLIEFLPYLRPAHAQNRAVQENIFASGQFRVKAGAHF